MTSFYITKCKRLSNTRMLVNDFCWDYQQWWFIMCISYKTVESSVTDQPSEPSANKLRSTALSLYYQPYFTFLRQQILL